MATAKKKVPAKKASAKTAAPAKKAPAKKTPARKDPIGDALTAKERAKYGPYTSGSETNYTPGDRSKTLRAYSRVTGYIPRSSGGGRGNISSMRGSGGLSNRGK
jgi:hypothetical protein